MKNTNKTYVIDGNKYRFDPVSFNAFINVKKYKESDNGNKITKTRITEELADEIHVSTDAIKNWIYGYNGPTDIEQIKAISNYFNIDYLVLLKKVEDHSMVDGIRVSVTAEDVFPIGYEKKIGDYIETKRCIRNIYNKMLAYVLETNKCFKKYQNLKNDEITEETYDEEGADNFRLKDLHCEMIAEVRKYYLDLSTKMYNDIINYMWGVMFDYHDDVAIGKLEGPNYKPTKKEKQKVNDRINEMKNYFDHQFYEDIENLFEAYIVDEDI